MMNKDFLKVLEDVMDEEDMVVKEEDFLKNGLLKNIGDQKLTCS